MNSLSEKLVIFHDELTLAKKNLDLLKNSVIFEKIKDKVANFENNIVELSNTFNETESIKILEQETNNENIDEKLNIYQDNYYSNNINDDDDNNDNKTILQKNDILLTGDSYLKDEGVEQNDEIIRKIKKRLKLTHDLISEESYIIEERKHKKRFNERRKQSANQIKNRGTNKKTHRSVPKKKSFGGELIEYIKQFLKKCWY